MKRLIFIAFVLGSRMALATPEVVPTWHLVFGGGNAPNRQLIVAEEEVQLQPDGTRRLRMIEQFESHPQDVDFYVFTMDYNVKDKRMRTYNAYRIFKDGRLEFEEKPSPWMAVPNNWMMVGFQICANPSFYQEHKDIAPTLGKLARPVDVVELNRRLLWDFHPPK